MRGIQWAMAHARSHAHVPPLQQRDALTVLADEVERLRATAGDLADSRDRWKRDLRLVQAQRDEARAEVARLEGRP